MKKCKCGKGIELDLDNPTSKLENDLNKWLNRPMFINYILLWSNRLKTLFTKVIK